MTQSEKPPAATGGLKTDTPGGAAKSATDLIGRLFRHRNKPTLTVRVVKVLDDGRMKCEVITGSDYTHPGESVTIHPRHILPGDQLYLWEGVDA